MVENSEIFYASSQTMLLQDPMVTCVQNLVLVLKMAVFERRGRKRSQGT